MFVVPSSYILYFVSQNGFSGKVVGRCGESEINERVLGSVAVRSDAQSMALRTGNCDRESLDATPPTLKTAD